MRFFGALLTFAAFVASALAQTIPACAGPCLQNADPGSCIRTDNACLCHNQAFINSTTQCIVASCNGADLTAAEQAAQALCAAVGVTLSATPTGGSAAPTATAPASSAAATSAAATHSATPASGALVHGAHAFAVAVGLGLVALAL